MNNRAMWLAVLGTHASLAFGQSGEFHFIESLDGLGGRVTALSWNGSVAAGVGGLADEAQVPFRWTLSGGRVDIPVPDVEWVDTRDLSGDGRVILIEVASYQEGRQPALIREDGSIQFLGQIDGQSVVLGASDFDGAHLVGSVRLEASVYRPVFWVEGSGYQIVDDSRFLDVTWFEDVTPDGLTILGGQDASQAGETPRAFLWSEADGVTFIELPPDATEQASWGSAISDDGETVAGYASYRLDGEQYWGAARWTRGELEFLGTLTWKSIEWADYMDGSGRLIAGLAYHYPDWHDEDQFVWTPSAGMIVAEEFLRRRGVPLPHDTNWMVIYAVSGDGSSVGGGINAPSLPGGGGAFVARLKRPVSIGP